MGTFRTNAIIAPIKMGWSNLKTAVRNAPTFVRFIKRKNNVTPNPVPIKIFFNDLSIDVSSL